ncbi:unnamed protein product [Alopecurus aequalis]
MDTGEQAAAEESSANRRERLLALRSAAAASSSSSPSAAPLPPPAWDLPEPDLGSSSAPRPPARFGFYTNPGAAFSSAAAPHKRKSPDSLPGPPPGPAPPHVNYGNNYPPPHQHHMAPPQMEPAPPGTIPWRSPVQFQNPMQEHGGAPPSPPPHWNPHSASPAQDSYPRSPNFGFRGSNVGRGGNPMNYGPRGSPVNYGPRGSPMNYGPRGGPMNYGPRGGPMNYEPRGGPMNYGPRGGPCSSSGRGRGENYYSGPGSRGGGRGGLGHQNHCGGQEQRDYHYKSMVDDPWKNLKPIVGSILIPIGGGSPMNYGPRGGPMNYGPRGSPMNYGPRGSPFSSSGRGRGENYYSGPGSAGGGRGGSGFQNHFGVQEQRDWLPESLRTKKHAPDQGQTIPNSGLSLAEYLDLSFNEVSKET